MADKDTIPPLDSVDPGAVAEGDAQLEASRSRAHRTPPPSVTSNAARSVEQSDAEGEQIESDLDSLQRDLASASDRYLRLAAEFDNYRRRVERERTESFTRAQGDLAARLLDALDDLERVSHHADGATAETLLQGVQLVERKLRQTLGAAGLEPIDAEGAAFDPNTMEAVAMVEAESTDEDDVVSDVFQRGYTFNGTLIRPARVRVKKHGA
ncbi:MAG: nucleotide exchange factor GrpE [Gemmatimonadota bacterium]